MSDKRPLCWFCGKRHYGCCSGDKAEARSTVAGFLASRGPKPKSETVVSVLGGDSSSSGPPADVTADVTDAAEPLQNVTRDVTIGPDVTPDVTNDDGSVTVRLPCKCGCGELVDVPVAPRFAKASCRQRANRKRAKRSQSNG